MRIGWLMRPFARSLALALASAACVGCAVHYYDKATGTEQLWSYGHIKMNVYSPKEGVQAVIEAIEIAGVRVGTDEGGSEMDRFERNRV